MRYLPETIKRRLRPLPQWTPIGARESQDLVRVQFTAADISVDVTKNHVISALKPLTLAVGLDVELCRAVEKDCAPTLSFVDQLTGRTIGRLQLRFLRITHLGSARLALFQVAREWQRCVQWPYRAWNRWLQARAIRQNVRPGNFAMTPDSHQQIMIFYIRPRPVVLVSVQSPKHSNIFPMDLIGPLWPDSFALALRTSSQSVETMKIARRIALSDLAAADVRIAHALGTHHKQMQIDLTRLPFAIQRSERFSLPVPAIALRVREIEIVDFETVGSHTFFICQHVSEQVVRDALPLCHTSGLYQHFRSRQGQPLPAALQA